MLRREPLVVSDVVSAFRRTTSQPDATSGHRTQKVRLRLIVVRLTPLADVGCRKVGDVSTPL